MAKGHAGLVGVQVGAQRCCTVTGICQTETTGDCSCEKIVLKKQDGCGLL